MSLAEQEQHNEYQRSSHRYTRLGDGNHTGSAGRDEAAADYRASRATLRSCATAMRGGRAMRSALAITGLLSLCMATFLSLALLLWWRGGRPDRACPLHDISPVPSFRAAAVISLPPQFASHFQLSPSQAGPSSIFSSHRCTGHDLLYSRRPDDHISRRCVLHNVCLTRDVAVPQSQSEVRLVVDYLRPEQPLSWGEPFSSLDSPVPQALVALRHGGRSEQHEQLHSLVVNVRSILDERVRHFLPGTHVMHQLLASGDMNFGHFLLDDVFAVWETVRSFDSRIHHPRATGGGFTAADERYAPESVQVLLITGCSNFSQPMDRMCDKFAAALFPVVSSHPLLTVQSAYSFYGVSDGEELCFETLIAGTGSAGAVGWSPNNRNRAAAFASYRNELFLAHGLDPFYRPPRHHLVLVNKRGRRGFTNLMAVFQQLRLVPRYAEIDMSVVDDFAGWSFVDQLRLLSNTTIVVSPCGGISMLFILLPSPAALIVSTYPERLNNGSVRAARMEGQVWDWQSNVEVMHYALTDDSDYVLPAGTNAASKYGLRNYANIVLKVERLLPLIDRAIFRAATLPYT